MVNINTHCSKTIMFVHGPVVWAEFYTRKLSQSFIFNMDKVLLKLLRGAESLPVD